MLLSRLAIPRWIDCRFRDCVAWLGKPLVSASGVMLYPRWMLQAARKQVNLLDRHLCLLKRYPVNLLLWRLDEKQSITNLQNSKGRDCQLAVMLNLLAVRLALIGLQLSIHMNLEIRT